MSEPPRPDDPRDDDAVAHDAWLREALRHAPDADAAPPAAVRDTILRAAQAEAARGVGAERAAPAAMPSIARQLAALWAWLARPPVAAGFASVMVATVVGLMWWDRPLEEALPPRETTTAAPAAAPAATPAPAPVEAPPAVPPRRRDAAPEAPRAKPAPPAPRPAPREPAADRLAAAAREEAMRRRQAERTAKSAEVERRASTAADATLGAAAPVAPAAPPPAPTTTATEEPGSTNDAAAAAQAGPQRAAKARRADAPAPSAFASRAPSSAPLGALRAAIATEPERWSWQRDGGATVPMGTPAMQWLQRLGETARGRWTASTERPEASAAAARAVTVVLLRDGRAHTTLRLGTASVEVDSGGVRQRADLPAAEATALRVELDQATR